MLPLQHDPRARGVEPLLDLNLLLQFTRCQWSYPLRLTLLCFGADSPGEAAETPDTRRRWCPENDSHVRPPGFQTGALLTELSGLMAVELTLLQISIERRPQVLNWIYGLVGCPRIELGSSGLRDRRITVYASSPFTLRELYTLSLSPRMRLGLLRS